MIRYDRRV